MEYQTGVTVEQEVAWLLAREVFPGHAERAHARTAAHLGTLSVAAEVKVEPVESNNATLLAHLQAAALGDEASRHIVATDVGADVGERLSKAGHENAVDLLFEGNRLTQGGKLITDIYAHPFRYSDLSNQEMHMRSVHELENPYLFEELYETGIYETHSVVVFSPCPLDKKTQAEFNFYMDTESCSIQFMSVDGAEARLETALVAGKAGPEAPRHDLTAIINLAAENGVEIQAIGTGEFIRYVLLIPKDQTLNGVTDIVEHFDTAAGGLFYGQAKPRQDYAAYKQECYQKNEGLSEVVNSITAQLIGEAHNFKDPMDAIMRLDELSEQYSVRHAILNDKNIDAMVFGPTAAMHIERARQADRQGDMEAVEREMGKAEATAISASCPLKKRNNELTADGQASSEDAEAGVKKWMACPFCKAQVFGDPCATRLGCRDCGALVVQGKVKSEGDGGLEARLRNRRQAVKKHSQEQPSKRLFASVA